MNPFEELQKFKRSYGSRAELEDNAKSFCRAIERGYVPTHHFELQELELRVTQIKRLEGRADAYNEGIKATLRIFLRGE